MHADLCLAISKTNEVTEYHKHAKYIWECEDYDDFGPAFDLMARDLGGTEDWRQLLTVPDVWMGGIKDPNEQKGSAAIQYFFHWFLLKNLRENGLLEQYDRFVVTRSDFYYTCIHMPIEMTDGNTIYIPDGESYSGLCDRQFIANAKDTEAILSFGEDIVRCPTQLRDEMMATGIRCWNPEQFLAWQMKRYGMLDRVKLFPYIMFLVRDVNEKSRWNWGSYDNSMNMIVKYGPELLAAQEHAKKFKSHKDWQEFLLQR